MSEATPVRRPIASASRTTRHSWWRGGLEAAYSCETGQRHDVCEDRADATYEDGKLVFVGVADGVGGGAYGEIASATILEHCRSASPEIRLSSDALKNLVLDSDAVVRRAIEQRTTRPGAATFAAAWFVGPSRATVVHIGDCRIYRITPCRGPWKIEALTADQTYGYLGEVPPRGDPDDPARMVGTGAVGEPPITEIRLREGQLLLLCSDGLHKSVANDYIACVCAHNLVGGRTLHETCRQLAAAAVDCGSHDDITALLVRRNTWFRVRRSVWWACLATLVAFALFRAGIPSFT